METLAELWGFAPLWGPLLVLGAAAYALVRYMRSRASSEAAPVPEPPPSASEAANLDSSHIGWSLPGAGAEDAFRGDAGGSAPSRGAATGHE